MVFPRFLRPPVLEENRWEIVEQVFYRLDVLPDTKPRVSEHGRKLDSTEPNHGKVTHSPHSFTSERVGLILVKVLRPTQHRIGHFGDIAQANLLASYGKTKPNTTKAYIHQSKEMCNTKQTQN